LPAEPHGYIEIRRKRHAVMSGGAMPRNAIEVLTSDHRAVEALFQQVEGGSYGRDEVVDKIVQQLSMHDGVERELLYPLLRKQLAAEGEDLAAHALDEHADVAGLLADLESTESNAARDRILQVLVPRVQAHVQEEEQLIFPKLASGAGDELEELGTKIEQAKKRAPTHPHPRAPRSTAGSKVAGKAAGLMDRAKDKMRDAASD
jgi:hemerythrin superfamily protein